MKTMRPWSLIPLLAALACESGSGPMTADAPGGLAVEVVPASLAPIPPTSGVARVTGGAVDQTVNVNPGQSASVQVPPGTYTVALAGIAAGAVVSSGERTGVVVTSGAQTQVTIPLVSFVPEGVTAPTTVAQGQPVSVTWTPVPAANGGYEVEWSNSPAFTGAQRQAVAQTSVAITPPAAGTYYFRVRGVTNRFTLPGHWSEATPGTAVRQSFTLTVTQTGSGTVTSAPPGISTSGATPSTNASFPDGTVVTLTATPAAGWRVQGWGGACAAAGTATVCQVTMTAARTVTVTFQEVSLTPPVITAYQPIFLTSYACQAGFRDLLVLDRVGYTDVDGDFPTTGTPLTEGTPNSAVQSEYRFAGETEWQSFPPGRTWSPEAGSSGSAGTLRTGACWRLPESNPSYVDQRARIRDQGGNWSDWTTTRVMLPASITVSPGSAVALTGGGSQQFTVAVRDANNALIPGNFVNWSNFNRPTVGSISADGRYTLATSVAGVDNAYSWAGRARYLNGIIGPSPATADSWWAPCWFTQVGLNAGQYRYLRMNVYQGQEYRFTLGQPPGGGAGGNPDLYIRLGERPTIGTFDAASNGPGVDEVITWTAPVDGLLWIGIHAASTFVAVRFETSTTDELCGFPGFAHTAPATVPTPGLAPVPLGWSGGTPEGGAVGQTPAMDPGLGPLRPRWDQGRTGGGGVVLAPESAVRGALSGARGGWGGP